MHQVECYFAALQEGDLHQPAIDRKGATIWNASGARVNRPVVQVSASAALVEKGAYRHFMEKEIHEQPDSCQHTLYAYLDNFVDPRAFRWEQSGEFVIMAVLGGMRSFWGPLIGAAIFVALQDYVSSRTENWMSVIGLVFVLVVRFFPRGVLGMLRSGAKA